MLLLCLCLTWTTAAAAAGDVLEQQSDALGLDELSDAAGEYAPEGAVGEVDLNQGLSDLLDTGSAELSGVVRKAVRSGVLPWPRGPTRRRGRGAASPWSLWRPPWR